MLKSTVIAVPSHMIPQERRLLGPIAAAQLAAYEKPLPDVKRDWVKDRFAHNVAFIK